MGCCFSSCYTSEEAQQPLLKEGKQAPEKKLQRREEKNPEDQKFAKTTPKQQLDEAVTNGDVTRLRIICDTLYPDINAKDMMGCTPLMAATMANHHEAVRFLLQRGADSEVRTRTHSHFFTLT
jgi:ankyrin repeat protein